MAIIVFERWKSRAGKASVEDPSINIVYGVKGTLDETLVDAAIDASSPTTWNGLIRQSWQKECLGPVDDGALWEVTVAYDRNDLKGAGTSQLSADLSGGRVKITQSKKTIAMYGVPLEGPVGGTVPPVTDPPDFRGSIGVTDTNIEGVEIVIPKMELTITAVVKASTLDSDYISKLDAATGSMNDFRFVIYYKGQLFDSERAELLYLGGPVTYRGNGDFEFVLKFIRERSVVGLKIGGTVNQTSTTLGEIVTGPVIVNKRGHDYLWVHYKEKKVDNRFQRNMLGVYVEQVYDETDFSNLFAPLNIEAP